MIVLYRYLPYRRNEYLPVLKVNVLGGNSPNGHNCD